MKLKITLLSNEGAIRNAIKQAKIANLKIIKLGIPVAIQKELLGDFGFKGIRLETLWDIPVEESETLQITTEFSRFQT